jgi:hypothetical protein
MTDFHSEMIREQAKKEKRPEEVEAKATELALLEKNTHITSLKCLGHDMIGNERWM